MGDVLVVGATGLLGQPLVEESRRRGHTVTGVSRRQGTDVTRLSVDEWVALLDGHDGVIFAAGVDDRYTPSAGFAVLHGRERDACRTDDEGRLPPVGHPRLLLPDDEPALARVAAVRSGLPPAPPGARHVAGPSDRVLTRELFVDPAIARDQLGVDIRDIDPALRETVAADRAHAGA